MNDLHLFTIARDAGHSGKYLIALNLKCAHSSARAQQQHFPALLYLYKNQGYKKRGVVEAKGKIGSS